LPLFIDDTGVLTVAALRARARRMARRHGIGLLIVDYLQLLTGGDRRDGRVQEVSEITRGLKALAKELNVPVLALSQLSRAVEGRVDKRPMLSDLRESGSIEQDADVVMFVYREEYYIERSDRRGTPAHIDAMGRAEVIIAKQRRGPTATVPLAFDAAVTRFRDPIDHGQRAAA
jgi:replicative DNA helicase